MENYNSYLNIIKNMIVKIKLNEEDSLKKDYNLFKNLIHSELVQIDKLIDRIKIYSNNLN